MHRFHRLVCNAGCWLTTALLVGALADASAAQSEDPTEGLSAAELEQLAAPVALHPDDVLSQIFMASTYPLEVVEAARWRKTNTKLEGDALAGELEQKPWDPSVKSLVDFPDVLEMMDTKLDWTQKLGNAVLSQQKELMDAVQRLRTKAQAEGNLESSKEQTVVTAETVIRIEPADPTVIYVPSYDPTVVYGPWPYPSYPPYYYYPPGYVAHSAMAFTAGVFIGAAWGYAWGGCNWGRGDIDIDINKNVNLNRNIDRTKFSGGRGEGGSWKHDPGHRRGVPYKDKGTAERFGRGRDADAARSRESFRGRTEGLGASSGRGLSDRAGAGKVTGAGDRAGSRKLGGTGRSGSGLGSRSSSSGRSAFSGSSSRGSTRSSSSRGRSSLGGGRSRGGRRR